MQIWKRKPHARILVTAYSNFAVDQIGKKVLDYLPKFDCFRYYSQSMYRRREQIDQNLLEISNLKDNGGVNNNELLSFRVILSTLINIGKISLKGLPKNKFDYIFIDECGSATESSALIPISSFITFREEGRVQVVLSGDPKQLGPVVQCYLVKEIGLGRSLMDRLMATTFYIPGTSNFKSNAYSKLLRNFRSHENILRVPNDLFYEGELISSAKLEYVNWALNWLHLPNKKFPIIFHQTKGQCKSKRQSTSLYNEQEINNIHFYIERIMTEGINGHVISQKEIGIVTPYKLQCQEIRYKFKRRNWNDIEVGSIEQFQGQERKVIIMSTVRSNMKSVGFLSNEKVNILTNWDV